jgi:hypothetical protein
MKLPRRLDDILKRKEIFLDDLRNSLEKSVIRLQSSLFEDAIENVVSRLDVRDGVLQDTANNYKLVSELESLYSTFNNRIVGTLLPKINKGIEGIININQGFFTSAFTDLPKRFEKVIEGAKKITDLRLGLQGGKMVRGGFLESILRTDPTEFKQYMSRAITGQMSMKDFIKGLRKKITGTEDRTGTLERQFQRYAYDVYQQYDRAYNKKLADEFGMKYFLYQGNLIKDSRDFCAAHYNKVWTEEEAQEWAEWTPAKGMDAGEFPEGYEIKAKDIYSVPSYLGYPGYDPVIDLGGYNCRHIYAPIPDNLAFKLRPELKEN